MLKGRGEGVKGFGPFHLVRGGVSWLTCMSLSMKTVTWPRMDMATKSKDSPYLVNLCIH